MVQVGGGGGTLKSPGRQRIRFTTPSQALRPTTKAKSCFFRSLILSRRKVHILYGSVQVSHSCSVMGQSLLSQNKPSRLPTTLDNVPRLDDTGSGEWIADNVSEQVGPRFPFSGIVIGIIGEPASAATDQIIASSSSVSSP